MNFEPVNAYAKRDRQIMLQEDTPSETRWKLTRQNDFRKSIIDVLNVGKDDLRLRLLADTIGTRDDTVKFHGVRALQQIDFAERKVRGGRINNEQAGR